jgi:hypothetical protein
VIQRAFYETPNLKENLLTQDLAIVYDSTSCRPYANTLRERLALRKSEKQHHCTFSVTKFRLVLHRVEDGLGNSVKWLKD